MRANQTQKHQRIPVDGAGDDGFNQDSVFQRASGSTMTSVNASGSGGRRRDEEAPKPGSAASSVVRQTHGGITDNVDSPEGHASRNASPHPDHLSSRSRSPAASFAVSEPPSIASKSKTEDEWDRMEEDNPFARNEHRDFPRFASSPFPSPPPPRPPPPHPPHGVPADTGSPLHRTVPPLDQAGNNLSYPVDTKVEADSSHSPNRPNSMRDMTMSTFSILKALHTRSTEQRLQLHVVTGPETPWIAQFVNIRWYHLHGDCMNFVQFREACLGVQDISARMKTLISKTLKKIENDELKVFSRGSYIEPGTVIRGEETDRDDPQSIIFSCVPYFHIQPQGRSASDIQDDLYPPRTLMETLYPYEHVRERDLEQAFRRYRRSAKSSANDIIHVPSLWIMNIGRHAVVTCGHRPFVSELGKLIRVAKEDVKSLKASSPVAFGDAAAPGVRNVRLMDHNGHVLLYPLSECRSYFQLEQKVRELIPLGYGVTRDRFQLRYTSRPVTPDSQPVIRKLLPRQWKDLINDGNHIFIDVSISMQEDKEEEAEDELHTSVSNATIPKSLVPPFSEWKFGAHVDGAVAVQHTYNEVFGNIRRKRVRDYFEDVGSALVQKYGDQAIPGVTFEQLRIGVELLLHATRAKDDASRKTLHELIVYDQISSIIMAFSKLVGIAQQLSRLFVADVNHTPFRRVWGSISRIRELIEEIEKRGSAGVEAGRPWDWTIRLPDPEADSKPSASDCDLFVSRIVSGDWNASSFSKTLRNAIESCPCCIRGETYQTQQSALYHLRGHFPQTGARNAPGDLFDAKEQIGIEWLRTEEQVIVEESNRQCLSILNRAVFHSKGFVNQLKELADGVQQEDGEIFSAYSFATGLVDTLEEIAGYYILAGQSLYDSSYQTYAQNGHKLVWVLRSRSTASSRLAARLRSLNRRSEWVSDSILTARKQLCSMARSQDSSGRWSLPAEYICSWVMRHLLLRPVSKNMSVLELYQEYLSTLQFQVNHHPTKKLLRSTHLLQEELSALEQVNSWQIKLVHDYCRVLDDRTYQSKSRYQSAVYAHVAPLLTSCLEYLTDIHDDYGYLERRCGPLSEAIKQSAEINAEDHGKAILVFTLVTTIFLPLSFVSSYLGMNTSDIRDMEDKQTLYWQIAIPLTVFTIVVMLIIAYKGDYIRSQASSIYHGLNGKQDTSIRGISVAQRKRATRDQMELTSTTGYTSLAGSSAFAPYGLHKHITRSTSVYHHKDPEHYTASRNAGNPYHSSRDAQQSFPPPSAPIFPPGPPAQYTNRQTPQQSPVDRYRYPQASVEPPKEHDSYGYSMYDKGIPPTTRPRRRPLDIASQYHNHSGPRDFRYSHRQLAGHQDTYGDARTTHWAPQVYPYDPALGYNDNTETNPFAPLDRRASEHMRSLSTLYPYGINPFALGNNVSALVPGPYDHYPDHKQDEWHSYGGTAAPHHSTMEHGVSTFAPPASNARARARARFHRRDVDADNISVL
ncbi:uncharacterized protein EI97DRAFT_244561 [Westerdykella ornata]|uniref:Uncharacterized protein n=1 Tax=Westerdykella ornata TaxID=318751 RepID=A0A6A6J613_WESOR|nr:uncharacterized protein EI97DRAFT_244561 [Westerdykella ornata]KAF2271832.1 hypothetical protein EI97DRAFT_244561 [Westerdykella ornata]